MVPRLLSPSQCAESLGFSPGKVIKLIKSGKLPGGKHDGEYRVRESALIEYIEETERKFRESLAPSRFQQVRQRIRSLKSEVSTNPSLERSG